MSSNLVVARSRWISASGGVVAALLTLVANGAAQTAQPAARDTSLVQRVAELETRLREMEMDWLQKNGASPPPPPAASTVKVTAGRDGFALKSADDAFQLKLRGYFQTDGRVVIGDDAVPATNQILMRRVRPVIDATIYRIMDVTVVPDFAGSTATLFDARIDLRLARSFSFRAGKYKPPVGLERLQSATDLLFVERGLPTNLAPVRDVGAQVYGEVAGGALSYAVGIFNGTFDLGNGDTDNGDQKDMIVRLFAQPFRARGPAHFRELGFGVAGSRGVHRGTVTAPFLPTYRSQAQLGVFAYRADATPAGTVIASGMQTRLAPQGYWYAGPLGVLAEWTRVSHNVKREARHARLEHDAWQLAGSWVITGEKAGFRGVTPAKPFDPATRGWGAVEIGARYGSMNIDEGAFPIFSDSAKHVRAARAWGVALNWYLARGVRMQLNFEETRFSGGAAAGNREPERAILSRMQFAF